VVQVAAEEEPNSRISDGTSTTAPTATAVTTASNVERLAAACSMVRPGRKRGRCAKAQPATMAATASAAEARADSKRSRQKSTSAGNAIPKHTSGMCTASDSACICRAWSR
jgi:hypothetical protein